MGNNDCFLEKYKLPFLFILFCISSVSIAQNGFHKVYDVNGGDNFSFGIFEADSAYISMGANGSGNSWGVFTMIDTLGNVKYRKDYKKSTCTFIGAGAHKTGYFFYGRKGSSLFILFLDHTGDSLSQLDVVLGSGLNVIDMTTNDTTFALLGKKRSMSGNFDMTFVAELDSLGSINWVTEYNDSVKSITPNNIEYTPDGGVVIGGDVFAGNTWEKNLFWSKLNVSGQIEWAKTFPDTSYKVTSYDFQGYVAPCDDGSFVHTGTIKDSIYQLRALFKSDINGNHLWTVHEPGTPHTLFDTYYRVKELPYGGYLCVGTDFSFGGSTFPIPIHLTRFDSLGTIIWTKSYTSLVGSIPRYQEYVHDLIVLKNGGYLLSGKVFANDQDAFILKVDSSGLLTGDREFLIEEEVTHVSLFPNPTKSRLTHIASDRKIERVEIYDIQGRMINAISANKRNLSIELTNKGFYLLKIFMESNLLEVHRVVVQ
jgi:hypothetical protein